MAAAEGPCRRRTPVPLAHGVLVPQLAIRVCRRRRKFRWAKSQPMSTIPTTAPWPPWEPLRQVGGLGLDSLTVAFNCRERRCAALRLRTKSWLRTWSSLSTGMRAVTMAVPSAATSPTTARSHLGQGLKRLDVADLGDDGDLSAKVLAVAGLDCPCWRQASSRCRRTSMSTGAAPPGPLSRVKDSGVGPRGAEPSGRGSDWGPRAIACQLLRGWRHRRLRTAWRRTGWWRMGPRESFRLVTTLLLGNRLRQTCPTPYHRIVIAPLLVPGTRLDANRGPRCDGAHGACGGNAAGGAARAGP